MSSKKVNSLESLNSLVRDVSLFRTRQLGAKRFSRHRAAVSPPPSDTNERKVPATVGRNQTETARVPPSDITLAFRVKCDVQRGPALRSR